MYDLQLPRREPSLAAFSHLKQRIICSKAYYCYCRIRYALPCTNLLASRKFNYAAKERGVKGNMMIWAVKGNSHLEASLNNGKDVTVSN